MSSELISALAEQLRTSEDVQLLIDEVTRLQESVYGTGKKNLENILKTQVRAETSRVLGSTLMSTDEAKSGTNEKATKLLEELLTEIKQLPTLRLEIAFQPSQETITKIANWLQTNTAQQWILNLVVHPSIEAGAIIEVNGLYRDFSLKETLQQAVQKATHSLFEQAKAAAAQQMAGNTGS